MGYQKLLPLLATVLVVTTPNFALGNQYLGQRIGALSELQHEVKGTIFAVDSRTIHIKGFSYDGTAPDAFFYGGFAGLPSDDGFIIPDENGGVEPLGRYRNKDVTLTLPEGITLKDIRWISVWCRAFAIDFGHVLVPSNLQYPRPQKIDSLKPLDHGVTSDRIVVVDAQTFLIPNFHYDGAAPGSSSTKKSSHSRNRSRENGNKNRNNRFHNRNRNRDSDDDSDEERQYNTNNRFRTGGNRGSNTRNNRPNKSNHFGSSHNRRYESDEDDMNSHSVFKSSFGSQTRSSKNNNNRNQNRNSFERRPTDSVFGSPAPVRNSGDIYRSGHNNHRFNSNPSGSVFGQDTRTHKSNRNNQFGSRRTNTNNRTSNRGSHHSMEKKNRNSSFRQADKKNMKGKSSNKSSSGGLSARELALRHFSG